MQTYYTGILLVACSALISTTRAEGCGCFDIALIIDDTGSMGGALISIKSQLSSFIASASSASPDTRVALVTFDDDVQVRLEFTSLQTAAGVSSVEQAIDALNANGGGDGPEASVPAMQSVLGLVDPLPGACQSETSPDFPLPTNFEDGSFRDGCAKLMYLVTDAPSRQCEKNTPSDGLYQQIGEAVAAQGIKAVLQRTGTWPAALTYLQSIVDEITAASGPGYGILVDGGDPGEALATEVTACEVITPVDPILQECLDSDEIIATADPPLAAGNGKNTNWAVLPAGVRSCNNPENFMDISSDCQAWFNNQIKNSNQELDFEQIQRNPRDKQCIDEICDGHFEDVTVVPMYMQQCQDSPIGPGDGLNVNVRSPCLNLQVKCPAVPQSSAPVRRLRA